MKELFACVNEGHIPTLYFHLFKFNDDILDSIFSTDITNNLI
jgi:hypothetical protein